MQWLLLAFAAATGVLNTIQAGSNTTLGKTTGTPVWSTAIVFAVALCTTIAVGLVSGQRVAPGTLSQLPWWAWIGGCFGALYVLCMMIVANKVGAAVFMALTVTAAIVTSMAMDHFGLMGFEPHPAGLGRIAGALAIIVGVGLIAAF